MDTKLFLNALDNVKVFPSDLILAYYKNCDKRLAEKEARRRLARSITIKEPKIDPQPVATQGRTIHYHIPPAKAKSGSPAFYVVTKGEGGSVNCTCADYTNRMAQHQTSIEPVSKIYPCKHGWRVLRIQYDQVLIDKFGQDNLVRLVTGVTSYYELESEISEAEVAQYNRIVI